MEYYSAIKKNKMMAFAGKWMELENIILSQSQKNQRMNVLLDKWMLIHNEEGLGKNGGTLDRVEENGAEVGGERKDSGLRH